MSVDSDRVVNGAGRIANVDRLDLDAGNIAHDGFRVAVDETMRSTSNPSVHLCGDVLSGPPQLSPIATYEGRLVGRNIVEGAKHRPDYAAFPPPSTPSRRWRRSACPKPRPRRRVSRRASRSTTCEYWFSARTFAETLAWSKIIVDEASDAVVGAHFVGHAGEELINIFGLAMKHGIKASQIRDFIFAYPTFSADIKHML